MQFYNVINQVISYRPIYRSEVSGVGRRPRANMAAREHVTGPLRNHSIIDIFINNFFAQNQYENLREVKL